ncbi:hypothetical protein VX037_18140 [Gordonia sp. Z-3]|uniref:hypothetical protein n=1 Tax=Gordonia sp. Z-3 TaxID=3115408 RepID=UPI002E2CFAE6|nr:hypothetical protein [Gordonia sp. Z-3]MED5802948.1 hypothetical protein [Gordonia sp. Z-3]
MAPVNDIAALPEIVTVEVTPGVLIYHDGHHRDGIVDNIPTATALHWAKQRYITCFYPKPPNN